MKYSLFFDVIESNLIYKWQSEIEKNDRSKVMVSPQKDKESLAIQLTDEQKTLPDYFELALTDRFNYIFHLICKKCFYFGIKTGIEIQSDSDK